PPPDVPYLSLRHLQEVASLEQDRPANRGPHGRSEAEDGEGRHGFPRSALAGQAQDLPMPELEAIQVDDLAIAEGDRKVAKLELRGARLAHRVGTRLGSSTSRRPSPNRLNATAVSRMAAPGNVTSHH